MLKMVYDAKFGQPIRDGDLEELVLRLLDLAADGNRHEFRFATDNILDAVRVAVRNEQFPIERLSIFYQQTPEMEVELKMYPSGGISPRPEGFCDRKDFYLTELL
jgi:hypothetical protein